MQPYQSASEEMKRQGELPSKVLKRGASLAASAYGGGIALNKILPFLSKYIPQDLAIKGLNKIDPRFGKFINTAISNGKSFEETKEFIKQKAMSSNPKLSPSGFPISEKTEQQPKQEKQQQNAQQNINVIEQYSPELHQFLANEVSKGRPVLEAGAVAQNNEKFKNIIKKLEQDHKTNWSAIIQNVYGGGQYGGAVNPPQNQQQTQQQPQSQGQQPGQGQQQLAAILQKINSRFGG